MSYMQLLSGFYVNSSNATWCKIFRTNHTKHACSCTYNLKSLLTRIMLKCTTIVSCKIHRLFASVIFDLKWPPLLKLCSQFLLHMLPPNMIKTIATTTLWQQLMATKLCRDNDGGDNKDYTTTTKMLMAMMNTNYNDRQQGIRRRETIKTQLVRKDVDGVAAI